PHGQETTILSLFEFKARAQTPVSPSQPDDLKTALGQAMVTQVTPAFSRVKVELRDHAEPDPQTTYKAIVTATPLAPLGVTIAGAAEGVELARRALASAEPGNKPSLLVREVKGGATLRLLADTDGYRVRNIADDHPLAVRVAGLNPESARKAVEHLEHIARWQQIAELKNQRSAIRSDAIKMEILSYNSDSRDGQPIDAATLGRELRLSYEKKAGKWKSPMINVRLTNTTDQKLYCMVLDLAEDYSISGLMQCEALEQGKPLLANDGKPFPIKVNSNLHKEGVTECRDIFKLIVSTEEWDAKLLEQDE